MSRRPEIPSSPRGTILPLTPSGGGDLLKPRPRKAARPPIVARNSIDIAKLRARRMLMPTKSRLSSKSTQSSTPSSMISVYTKPGPNIVLDSVESRSCATPGSRPSSVRFKEKVKRPKSSVSYNETLLNSKREQGMNSASSSNHTDMIRSASAGRLV